MDNLKKLIERCKCGVFISVNKHRDYYQSVAVSLQEMAEQRECPPEIPDDIRQKMIEKDTIVEVHFYPNTPITFFEVFHYDLDSAISWALQSITPKKGEEQ